MKTIEYYLDSLKRNLFYQNILLVLGGNILAKSIGILTAPVLTRLYSREDFGVFSLIVSITGIAGSISTLRYGSTIPLAKDERMADNLLKLSFLITFSLSILWFIGIQFFGNALTNVFSVPELSPFLWILPIIFLGQGLYEALNNWAIREKKFRIITYTNITQNTSSAVIKIGLGLMKIKPLGLILGQLVQEYAGIGRLLSKLVRQKPEFLKSFSWSEINKAFIRYKDFPLMQTWSQLLLAMGIQLPVFLMGSLFGLEVVGLFGLAQSMISLPMNLLGQAVSQVYFAEISKYGKDNLEKIYNLSFSIIKKMFWAALIPISLILLFGPWIFKTCFGDEWFEAGVYSRILSILILFRFISTPIMNCLNVVEKQGIQLVLNIVRTLLILLVFFIAKVADWETHETLLLYSGCLSVFYAFVILFILRILKKSNSDEELYQERNI